MIFGPQMIMLVGYLSGVVMFAMYQSIDDCRCIQLLPRMFCLPIIGVNVQTWFCDILSQGRISTLPNKSRRKPTCLLESIFKQYLIDIEVTLAYKNGKDEQADWLSYHTQCQYNRLRLQQNFNSWSQPRVSQPPTYTMAVIPPHDDFRWGFPRI